MSLLNTLILFFIISLIFVLMTPSHLLTALMALELITLFLLFAMICPSTCSNLNTSTFLILVTLGASEASLGLAIMVSMILSYGSDKTHSLDLLP